MKNKSKRKISKKVKRKRTTQRRKLKGSGTGEEFKDKKVIIDQFTQKKLPQDLTKRITRQFSASTIQDYQRKYISKRRLKHDFEQYNINTGNNYDPMDPELVELVEMASRILKREDYNNPFWRRVMGDIYIGLLENQYIGGPGSIYYNKCEIAFKKLLKNVMNYNNTNQNYLDDEYLYQELVGPLVDDEYYLHQ